ncbi:hypothetical protein [Gaoshiqia sediminis]|uniref:Outer membrane protein beta-barrel domain-containing protein n=1 Tax=Gaoshiqia sediminis TaxID=2986998 RepID=A0AA41Y692_9BACT|nr:hypothetical protein [Gaoshiqia sediminis]MCW0481678.1 hypothetical protein [Gaoshiqia sediminis]
MKMFFVVLCMLFLTFQAYAQVQKGDLITSVEGNYRKDNRESGVYTNSTSIQRNLLDVGGMVGFAFSDRIVAGFGLDYVNNKETRTNRLFLADQLQMEEMQLKSKGFAPNLFLGYYFPVVDRLYLSSTLKVSYGKIKSDFGSIYVGREMLNSEGLTSLDPDKNYARGYSGSSDADLFGLSLNPELTWFAIEKFGIYLGLGGIEYALSDWDTDNSNWLISFSPAYWTFGIKIRA